MKLKPILFASFIIASLTLLAAAANTEKIERNPFYIKSTKPIRPEQLMRVKYGPDHEVEFKMDHFLLAGQPSNYINLTFKVVLCKKDDRDLIENAEGAVRDLLTTYFSKKDISDMTKSSEIFKLRETLLLFLNNHLRNTAVREVYILRNDIR